VMGQPALADDPRFVTAAARKRNEQEVDRIITGWTSSRDRWEVTRSLQAVGVAAFPSMSNKDLVSDDHLRERAYFAQLDHPEIGRRIHAGIPWRFGQVPGKVATAAPLRGADTEAVLTELLGYAHEKIEQLRKAGVLR
jgi:crotonobetainyl-CoA:carnitine CoA-transferase CaiB-like acyl-CoA transferase